MKNHDNLCNGLLFICMIYNVSMCEYHFNEHKCHCPIDQILFLTCFYSADDFKMDLPFGVNTWYGLFPKTAKCFHHEYLISSRCPFFLILPPPHK